jgi:O-glycosyl hydrolase
MRAQFVRHIFPGCMALAMLVMSACGGGGGGGGGSDSASVTTTSASSGAGASSSAASSQNAVNASSVGLSWIVPTAITYGTALSASQLNATAGVPGSFSYSPLAGTVPNAGTQTLTVTFTPSDTTKYQVASKTVSLTVNKANPAVVWDAPMAATYGSWLSDSALSAKASVDGSFTYSPATGAYLSKLGSVVLSATFTPTDTANYNTVTASQALAVVKGNPGVKWAQPAPVVQGTALSATQLNASTLYGVAGTFTYSPALGTVMSTAGSMVLTATFTPKDSTDFNSVTATTVLTVVPATGTATVDFGSAAQTIRGFGASDAWYSQMAAARISKLYGTDSSDLGLSIMRVRIAPTTWNSAAKTADTSAWTAELANAKAAQDLGATIFATPWTPPASMKTNNDSRKSKLYSGNLATSSYADYASYLNAYINYAAAKSVSLYAISMQNEPDWDPQTYESCLWTADQMASWAASYGAAAVNGSSVKLMMPESFYFSAAMSDAALNNATAAANISIIGGHLYGSDPYYPTHAKNAGKELWMTEHYLDSTAKTSSATAWKTNLADAIAAASEIHTAMAVGQYNAYVWWWLVNSNDNQPTGLIDSSNNPTYFGIGMEHFSRFVRPGYVRYAATAQPVSGVYFSAYAGNGHHVIVVVNSNTTAVDLPIQISNATLTSLTPYQTSASSTFAQLNAVSVSGNKFTASVPAQSITTYVQ